MAYKGLGSARAGSIPTSDLLTGRASNFTTGLKAFQASKAAAASAAAEADARKGSGMFSRGRLSGGLRIGGGSGGGKGEGGAEGGAEGVGSGGGATPSPRDEDAESAASEGARKKTSFLKRIGKALKD